MPQQNSIFVKLLKKYTDIDIDFIDIFFKKFKIGGELEFEIDENDIVKYLGIAKITLRKRLNNEYSKKKLYYENADYIKIKSGATSAVTYMVNYECFERLAMASDSEKSEVVRLYFSKLRKFISENQHAIFQAMEKKADDLKLFDNMNTIYFFAVDKRKFKIGKSAGIVKRLRNYNIGRIKEIEFKYLALVKNKDLIEKCMKVNLKPYQVIKNREIYEIDPIRIKKVIDKCYCDNVSKKENLELYEEISNLLGMYAYIKDKINIKPYIIIDK
jgi:hypothetical protein